jgi:AcrR family transcriptional regulator
MALGENPNQPGSHPVPIVHQFNGKKKALFLTELARTGSIRGSAARVGVNRTTIYDHAKKDPSFADSIERARADWEQAQLDLINDAARTGKVIERQRGNNLSREVEPGDWRAAAWLLEHHPNTRETYAGIMRQKVEVGGDPDGIPVETKHTETLEIEPGPEMMERLGRVIMVLARAGKIRLPDPNEMIDVTPRDGDES